MTTVIEDLDPQQDVTNYFLIVFVIKLILTQSKDEMLLFSTKLLNFEINFGNR
ncbi:hypothetical protein [Fredinandcohnia quinoae]|uniref:hypothetical protein n=1 Tax=Fredinandcohnia quinoae TaxID=2918902 RepID=UPI0031F5B2B0